MAAVALIPFDSENLPAYVKKAGRKKGKLTANVRVGFPFLSIKGKTWTIVKSSEDKTIIHSPKDPDTPASNVSLVIIDANEVLSRIYYEEAYEEGSSDSPDCFSNDGQKPDVSIQEPQAKSCAVCRHAVYGTGVNGKGFRCATARRLAVAPAGALENPMLLRVPGGSLKNLALYDELLAEKGVDFDMVVTNVRFDPSEATPRLIFKPVNLLPEEIYQKVEEVAKRDIVKQILGMEPTDMVETAQPAQEAAPAPEPEPEKPKKRGRKPKAKPKPEPEPEPEVAVQAEPEPEPEQAKVTPITSAAGKGSELSEELESLLDDFDD